MRRRCDPLATCQRAALFTCGIWMALRALTSVRMRWMPDTSPYSAELRASSGDSSISGCGETRLACCWTSLLSSSQPLGSPVAKQNARATIYNLFSACEHLAKARLMLVNYPRIRSSKRHNAVHSAINRYLANSDEVDKMLKDIFNRLARDRNPALYRPDVGVAPPSDEEIAFVDAQITLLARSVSQR